MSDSKVHHLIAADFVLGSTPKRQRSKAKPRIDYAMIKQAERRTGKKVTSITTPDGTTLTFGQMVENGTVATTADDELARWRRKKGYADQG